MNKIRSVYLSGNIKEIIKVADSFYGNWFVHTSIMWPVSECITEMDVINLYNSVG